MTMSFPPPPADKVADIMRLVVRQYPEGGPQHERAIRLAINLAWPLALASAATTKESVNG